MGSTASPELINQAITILKGVGVTVVAFDVDLTITQIHSRGIAVDDDKLQAYKRQNRIMDGELPLASAWVDSIVPDFVAFVPRLLEAGINVTLATFGDDAYTQTMGQSFGICGHALVTRLLRSVFPESTVQSILRYSVLLAPHLHPEDDIPMDKTVHLACIAEAYHVDPGQVLLLDDQPRNVISAIEGGYQALHVTPVELNPGVVQGFKIENITDQVEM